MIDRDPFIQSDTDNRSASVIQIESSKVLPVIVVLAILSGAAIALAWFATLRANDSEREARMLQYYLLELDAKVIASGIKRPEDSIARKLKEN